MMKCGKCGGEDITVKEFPTCNVCGAFRPEKKWVKARRTQKARMKTNLVERYKGALPGELEAVGNEDIEPLLRRIEGKEVTLVFTDGDAFEKEDDNVWLPDVLWDPI